jgi:hypothetical protein
MYVQNIFHRSMLGFLSLPVMIFSIFALPAHAQEKIFHDEILQESIKSVDIFRKGWKLSPPILNLESNDVLMLTFDDLNDELGNYHYTIVHCNADWTASSLTQQEYLEGFYENPIDNYRYSSNTTVPYTHYTLEIPNNDIRINTSGNFTLLVYKGFDQENLVFTKRFFVYEPLINIRASVKRPVAAKHFETGQEVDVTIDYEGYTISDPFDELQMVIVQNMDWNMKVGSLKPTYVRNNELVYDYNDENVFPGHSEFRYFDIKSIRYQSEYIRAINYDYQYYHVQLVEDKDRHFGKYFYNDDINGKYLIDVQEYRDASLEADYVWVYFTLPYPTPLDRADIFVYGELTGWQTDKRSLMTYNFEKKAYETRLLLKQGYYNYCYAVREHDNPELNIGYIEGNHFETENDYFIFVYHRPFHLRYDRLIGVQAVNSIRQNNP